MGEFNRLQLESKDVSRGRTRLGAAGIAEREELESTRRIGQTAIVAAGLASKAIATGKSQVTEAGAVLKSVDEEFGRARRATAAIGAVQDATFRIEQEVDALIRDPDVAPEELAQLADNAVMRHRNSAVGAGAKLGEQLRGFIIEKMGSVRAKQVGRARDAGYEREIKEKTAEFLERSHQLTLKMNAPDTTRSERVELLNDKLVLIQANEFYLGAEVAQKYSNQADLEFRKQEFYALGNVDPALALANVDQFNFTPEQKASAIAVMERRLEQGHAKIRREEQDAKNRKAKKNEDYRDEIVSRIAQKEPLDQIQGDIDARVIHDDDYAVTALWFEGYRRQRRADEKDRGAEQRSDPATRLRLINMGRDGAFASNEEAQAAVWDAFNRGDLNSTDSLIVLGADKQSRLQEQSQEQIDINRETKNLEQTLHTLFSTDDNNLSGTTSISDGAQTDARALANAFTRRLEDKKRNGESINVSEEKRLFLVDNQERILPYLLGKTLGDITPFDNLDDALANPNLSSEYKALVTTFDTLIRDANARKATAEKVELERQVTAAKKQEAAAAAALEARIGPEAVVRQEARREARREEEARRIRFENQLDNLAENKPTPSAPVFRFVDGEPVRIDSEGTVEQEKQKIVQQQLIRNFGDLLDTMTPKEIADARAVIMSNLERRLRERAKVQKESSAVERIRRLREEQGITRTLEQDLETSREKLKLLNEQLNLTKPEGTE